MRILFSNDDGIQAEGIRALVRAFAPHHEVIVAAPARQQSGMAHALTVGIPIEVSHDAELEAIPGVTEAWAIDGTPTDSVKLYVEAIAQQKPDVVISGINHGANLTTDITYSGTVGAAMEGYLHDIDAFAVSLDSASELSYDEVAEVFRSFVEQSVVQKENREKPLFYNVNFPVRFHEDGVQYVFGRQGKRDYLNAFHREEKDGKIFYTMAGEIYDTDKGEPTDIYATEQGYVSVTPLIIDATDYPELDRRLGQ